MLYGAGFLKLNTDKLKNFDRSRAGSLWQYMGALHLKSAVDRVYLSRKMGGQQMISCEACTRMEVNNLRWYVRNSNPLIEGVKAAEIIELNYRIKIK